MSDKRSNLPKDGVAKMTSLPRNQRCELGILERGPEERRLRAVGSIGRSTDESVIPNFGTKKTLCGGALLGIVGCLATSLASTD